MQAGRELAVALDRMAASVARAGHALEGFLVQEMVRGGHEVIFGISTDPRFGPLLMFGLGGRYVEVFQDVTVEVKTLVVPEGGDLDEDWPDEPLDEGNVDGEAVDSGEAADGEPAESGSERAG